MIRKLLLLSITLLVAVTAGMAQLKSGTGRSVSGTIDYLNPKEYEVAAITVTGTENLDANAIRLLSGLSVGDRIAVPGEKTASVVKNLWKQGLFSDVNLSYTRIEGDKIFLEIQVVEQPRLSRFAFKGVNKTEADDLREKINLYREKIVTTNLVLTTKRKIRSHFVEKGYHNTEVEIIQKNDTLYPNHVYLNINVDRKKKVKINKIHISGNEELTAGQIKGVMKETKEKSKFRPFYEFDTFLKNTWRAAIHGNSDEFLDVLGSYKEDRIKLTVFKSSKYLKSNFKTDKDGIIARYNSKGYRDAKIVSDSVVKVDDESMDLYVRIEEGNKYYFRNIDWLGNTKYSTEILNNILGINSGDVYNPQMLDERLFMNQNGADISSLYMDDGYLFFQINPIETHISNDSVDLELRIYEGQQARINRIIVTGNTKTNDHVVLREIRTRPGDLFSRSDIIRTQRELSVLGYFDPEQMNVLPKPNPADGTVDVEYVVAERPSDQIEQSGGWGGGRIVGTLGLSFSNFSLRNILNGEAYRPLPSGDGQRLSIRAQTNGLWYQSYNFSFTEPWLGGKKPNALTFSVYHSILGNGQKKYIKEGDVKVINPNLEQTKITGVSLGLGKRLKWPDDNFSLYTELSYQRYNIFNDQGFIEGITNGASNNAFAKIVLSRSSISDLNFPRSGNQTTLSTQFTLPYSLFNPGVDYANLPSEDKYLWIEYHKWKFTSAWYTPLTRSEKPLVFYAKVGLGALGSYNSDVGTSPFERFNLGGDGLTGYRIDSREVIALRGYDNGSLSPQSGASLISKITFELRYPFSLSQSAMIYGLAFVEGGNTWTNFNRYNPFELNRSAGMGVRVFLPMFGLLGLDYGFRLDDSIYNPGMQRGQLHFTIGANLGEL